MNKLQKSDFSWHADQPDVPLKSAAEMKAFFDAPSQTLMDKTNELIGDLYGDEEKAGKISEIYDDIDLKKRLLQIEIVDLSKDIGKNFNDIRALETQDQEIQESITALEVKDQAIQNDITALEEQDQAIQNDIAMLQDMDMALSGDIAGVKSELEIKIETDIATEISPLKNSLNTQKNILDTLSDEFSFIGERKQDKLEAGENITIENNVISADAGGIHEISGIVTTAEIKEGMSKAVVGAEENEVVIMYMEGGEYTGEVSVEDGSIILKAYNADGYVTNIIIYDTNGEVYSITQEYMNDTATLNTLTPKSPRTEDTEISSWSAVQKIVRLGLASQIFEVGDQFVSIKNGGKLVWDVIGFDHDFPIDNDEVQHSMTLQLHDATGAIQFDAQEAFYYAADGLAAGTYNFTVGEHDWVASEVGKTYQFTLTQPVPANGQIVFTGSYNATMEGTNISTYASSSSTIAIETVELTAGTSGISLGTINNAAGGNFNSCQRAFLGSNNYSQSAMRQYLNSEAAAGSVWTPQSNFDRPPSWANTTAGFLHGMDADFLSVIGEVGKTTALNTVSEDEESVTTSEKFFLLSRSEGYGGNETSINEGAAYPYYSENSVLSEAGLSADSNRIKYSNKEAQYGWLRSPYADDSNSVRTVFPTGYVGKLNASISLGVAPVCCIY